MSYFPLSNFKLRWNTIQSILRMPTAFNLAELTQERTLFVAGILVFSLMGSFVLWGPAPKRLKGSKRSRAVKGLANMGETCFLNTLLQALAACPLFCLWLEQHKDSRLASALHEIITFVNGYGTESDTPLFPRAVVDALSAHGWSMGLGQQDSHELFFILMTSLEEQATPASKPKDILALLDKEGGSDAEILVPAVKEDSNQNEKQESPTNKGNESKKSFYISRAGKQMKTAASHKFEFPFRGQQLSQLTCTICSKSSVVQHQAYDCLSLTLPAKGFMTCSLDQLLSSFTAPEQVSGVLCEHCSKGGGSPTKTSFVKQLSIGRLPKSLCIHIQRTSWTGNGQAYKRHDFVSFPEVLVMDKFTYFHKERLKRALLKQLVPRPTELNLTPSAANDSNAGSSSKEVVNQVKDIIEARHKYLLQAVVVHIGEVNSGHFVTFRRVPQPSKCQEEWVCTSDDQCQNSCLAEVLKAEAYMLFYEKIGCSPGLSSSQG